jgi:mRNA interferase MazF
MIEAVFSHQTMIKLRPAIVISPRLPHWNGLCTVVPISSTAPAREFYVVRLSFDPPLPKPYEYEIAWAKCDMLATVCFARLDLFTLGRDYQGKRKYIKPKLSVVDFHRVKKGVLAALGMT